MRLLPSKAIRLMIGFSTTLTTSVLPSRRKVTSANRPVANSAFSDSSIRCGSNGSPCLTTRYERTVVGSIRWVPSTRMSEMTPPEKLACATVVGCP